MEGSETCAACHERPATRIFTAPVRPDGPIEDAAVCDDCYPVLILALERDVLENAAAVIQRYGRN